MKYFLFLFLILPINVNADSFSRSPSGTGIYPNVVYTVTIDDIENICLGLNPNNTYWNISSQDINNIDFVTSNEQYPLTQTTGIFTLSGNIEAIQTIANCGNIDDGINIGTGGNIEYNANNILFTLDQNVTTNIWGTNNGFWGDDFSTVDIKDSLQASVQATGVSIWPLFYLIGVPLAFILAYYILDFLYYSIYLGQTSKISSRWPYLDKMVYLPYKGYKRLRSRKWNRENNSN